MLYTINSNDFKLSRYFELIKNSFEETFLEKSILNTFGKCICFWMPLAAITFYYPMLVYIFLAETVFSCLDFIVQFLIKQE